MKYYMAYVYVCHRVKNSPFCAIERGELLDCVQDQIRDATNEHSQVLKDVQHPPHHELGLPLLDAMVLVP